MIRHYLFNILIAADQFLNTVLGGDPDETISSRAAKQSRGWGWHVLGAILETIDPGHLARSREDDEGNNGTF